jgi:hypothetical protein
MQLEKLFADAAQEKLEDKALTQRLNEWLPADLRQQTARPAATKENSRN